MMVKPFYKSRIAYIEYFMLEYHFHHMGLAVTMLEYITWDSTNGRHWWSVWIFLENVWILGIVFGYVICVDMWLMFGWNNTEEAAAENIEQKHYNLQWMFATRRCLSFHTGLLSRLLHRRGEIGEVLLENNLSILCSFWDVAWNSEVVKIKLKWIEKVQ